MRWRIFVAVAAVAAFAAGYGAVKVRGGVHRRANVPVPGAVWSIGYRDGSNFNRPVGTDKLSGTGTIATFHGKRYLETGQDGNFEFEHAYGNPNTTFDARTSDGAPTPIEIGRADGQNVTPLVVPVSPNMKNDAQSWQLGDATPSAIDGHGRLRLDGIVLYPLVRNGHVTLYAVLPDGTVQRLVPVGGA